MRAAARSFETGPTLMQSEPDYYTARYVALGG
jgi:hypothetical protein